MELFVEMHVQSENRQKGVQQFIDNCAQYFVVCQQPFSIVSYYFLELNLMVLIFISRRHITASWGRDTGDDPSTHPDFDPDSWMEARSSGGPDRNWVYGLSNTTAANLRTTHSVSTVSAQSQEFVALQQHIAHLIEKYERLSADYEQLCQMSWILDHKWKVRVCPLFGRLFLGTTSLLLLLLLLLQHRHCFNLIFIWTYKFGMNIWILYYSSLFLHISILYNFIFYYYFLSLFKRF
jgi:hypothetical protein